ncbi:hypothetical protein GIB67_000095 [Kingdonia uniflora]|uniref:RRM domain-containing protein n=1 Tax=Kingdonia uniflora TaxID=39325 RepID=A0A7J7M5P8_9MAGN|nr:hypothetical protein GIB67_000095 [Kingdonia uniflora]
METVLDMSLDDMIKKSKSRNQRGGRGRGKARPERVQGGTIGRGRGTRTFGRGKDVSRQHGMFEDSLLAAGYSGIETGTKLYVSNLDYGVTNEDIKELFSEVGDVKRYSVHYDSNGRPNLGNSYDYEQLWLSVPQGTAEVVYIRKSDALAAMKRYNGVQLDGKSMKIENIGTSLGLPVSGRVNLTGGANGRGKRTVVMASQGLGRARGSALANRGIGKSSRGAFQRGGRGRGAGSRSQSRGRGRGRKQPTVKSADELNKDLESYHAEAMNTS